MLDFIEKNIYQEDHGEKRQENTKVDDETLWLFDNAPVHSADSMIIIDDMCISIKINLVRLPTYSPELNPTEKIFNFLKSKIYRGGALNIHVIKYYTSSIYQYKYFNYYTRTHFIMVQRL